MLFGKEQVREGMVVWSADGEKLGKVLACGEDTFVIEKGFLFPKDYVARYGEVSGISAEGELRLMRTKDELTHAGDVTGLDEGEELRARPARRRQVELEDEARQARREARQDVEGASPRLDEEDLGSTGAPPLEDREP